jgi:hypothetical protein
VLFQLFLRKYNNAENIYTYYIAYHEYCAIGIILISQVPFHVELFEIFSFIGTYLFIELDDRTIILWFDFGGDPMRA